MFMGFVVVLKDGDTRLEISTDKTLEPQSLRQRLQREKAEGVLR